MDSTILTHDLLAGRMDPANFGHPEHVAVAFELLRRSPFVDGTRTCANAINALATRAGAPDKFHTTVTVAFLALISERLARAPTERFDTFIERNPDLLSGSPLKPWYSAERLADPLARTAFLLPDRVPTKSP